MQTSFLYVRGTKAVPVIVCIRMTGLIERKELYAYNYIQMMRGRTHFSNRAFSESRLDLSGVYTSNLLKDLEFSLGQILFLYEAKYLGQIFSQTFCFKEGQYLAQIKFQIV